jgi:hypothetical protein
MEYFFNDAIASCDAFLASSHPRQKTNLLKRGVLSLRAADSDLRHLRGQERGVLSLRAADSDLHHLRGQERGMPSLRAADERRAVTSRHNSLNQLSNQSRNTGIILEQRLIRSDRLPCRDFSHALEDKR